MFTPEVVTDKAVITASTEQELNEKLIKMKDKYKEVLEIHFDRHYRNWFAYVSI